MYIDSHCHLDRLDLTPYGGSFHRLMEETRQAGVCHILCVGIRLESYPAMRRLVGNYPDVSVSVGVHPNDTGDDALDEALLSSFLDDPKVVALGETGLDYHYRRPEDAAGQREQFRTHIRLARACRKPIIIHTREASEDTVRILREEDAGAVGGVFHCFTEDWETARRALDLGFYISFSGIVTFRNADALRKVAQKVPTERFLIETDSPYLAPIPHRGKPNYPVYVRHVAACLGDLRGVPEESIAAQSSENFRKLFRVPG